MIRTLSNDLTVLVPTRNMSVGYTTTEIFADDTRVFMGRSYIESPTSVVSTMPVNLNDIAIQNRLKYDFLKLNDNGNVVSNPLRIVPGTAIATYFRDGLISNYKVVVTDSSTTPISSSTNINVLTGYDYPNDNLLPNVDDPEVLDTSVTRIMQGCYWIATYPETIGQFSNRLLPHYPAILTQKYGLGLLIQVTRNENYSLTTRKTASDSGFMIGKPYATRTAAQFFSSLALLLPSLVLEDEGNTSVYFKESSVTTSSNTWGTFASSTKYYAEITIENINVDSYWHGQLEDSVYYTRDDSYEFEEYLNAYRRIAMEELDQSSPYYNIDTWNIEHILEKENAIVYTTPDFDTTTQVYDDIVNYERFYVTLNVGDILGNNTEDYVTLGFVTPKGIQSKSVSNGFNGKCPIAIIDGCPGRYYLAWNDRYGDIQSLPFEGKHVYSEDIETDEIKDYKLRRKVSQKSLLPKWKLNTKWITEDVYPMYESIFVSPYLLLYDTKTDRSWNVLITDSQYTEKIHKNEKMINLEINLEAIQTQNYIY